MAKFSHGIWSWHGGGCGWHGNHGNLWCRAGATFTVARLGLRGSGINKCLFKYAIPVVLQR